MTRHESPESPGPPAGGRPTAFAYLLGELDDELRLLHAHLGRVADDLELALVARRADGEPLPRFLTGLDERLILGEIRDAVLDARHKLDGGLTAVIRARPLTGRPP